MYTVLITGGAGFIGSAVIREIIRNTEWKVIDVVHDRSYLGSFLIYFWIIYFYSKEYLALYANRN